MVQIAGGAFLLYLIIYLFYKWSIVMLQWGFHLFIFMKMKNKNDQSN